MEPLIKFLGTSKNMGEMVTLGYAFGGIAIVIGLWQLLVTPKQGQVDYYLSTIAGLTFIMLIAFVVKWGLDPLMGVWGKALKPSLGFDIHSVLNLNYVVMGIIAGIIVVNVFKIPDWAQNGVRLSRLGLKTGVILLGALYSLAELAQLGKLSVVLIGFFVLGSVGLVLWMGARRNIPNSMAGVLSAGLGVCGVSASVASAPVVQAKSSEIAYTIGTILLWGILMMFIFPIVGKAMGMGPIQFGAWAGTGILNSAQVAGAALAFDPNGIETLKVAEIFNITRVLFLPIIVLWLAAWYVKHEVGAQKVQLSQVLISKFPIFVLGFILMFALSSMGVFAPTGHYQGKYFSSEQVKEDNLLRPKEVRALEAELPKVTDAAQAQALRELIASRKLTSRAQDDTLKHVAKIKGIEPLAKSAIEKASKVAWHDSRIIRAYRDWIAWLFAFGLIGLGMQITVAALKQAGGKPLIIGGVVGTVKAVGSLIVVLLFVREFI
ncbi:MAG: putative sulfate exporter family transporter [Chloroflexi bacterium]|nr:putative sulfate exporter family transporter [Chloroflexota bacterium]